MSGFPVVAVVDESWDADQDGIVVWHVVLGINPASMGRLVGGWLLPHDDHRKLDLVTRSRVVLATVAGDELLKRAGIEPPERLDLAATWVAALAERDRLQAIFDEEQDKRAKSRKMVEPRWPAFPELPDCEDPPIGRGIAVPFRTLSIAAWLQELATAWDLLETERLRKRILRVAGEEARPLPVTITVTAMTA